MNRTKFTIDKGVPITTVQRGKAAFGTGKYPFRDMEVGDSFFIPCPNEERRKMSSRVVSSARPLKPGVEIVTRFVEGGIRCWRI